MPSLSGTYPVPPAFAAAAHIDEAGYQALYRRSLEDPEGFWSDAALELAWIRPFTRVREGDFSGKAGFRWFADGTLNASVNCLDRHLESHGDRPAILWEGDEPDERRTLSYRDLHEQVSRLANALAALGVEKGDFVGIYLPVIPEAVVAVLATARLGAVHALVFSGFSPESLAQRLNDCGAAVLITADESRRGGRVVPLKRNADLALADSPSVRSVVVVSRTGAEVPVTPGRDVRYEDILAAASPQAPPAEVGAEDPLFILYTSGSTGKPKGVIHTTGGYLVHTALSFKHVFDYHDGDIHWCTADIAWVTAHSYVLYGPLANAATIVMFEGVPNYPTASRFWEIVDRYRVTSFYTAPTAVRSLMREGDAPVLATGRTSLRLLGSVGEPINPEAWLWYHKVVGSGRCPIVDTYWQTETGAILISPFPGATPLKPGSATRPYFGVRPVLLDGAGREIDGAGEGNLAIAAPWPGQARTIHGDHERYLDTYFRRFPGYYVTGDGARRDEDGYFWITGRVDDVINVSGHRLGTVELETAIASHPKVAEAAVVGFPHDLKGQGIYAYVTLKAEFAETEDLRRELIAWVRARIGPIASPDVVHWTSDLPKNRSGKILRRILARIARGETEDLGDRTTVANPEVIPDIIGRRAA